MGFLLEIAILIWAWWIYLAELKGHWSEWRSKVSLVSLILMTACAALLPIAIMISPEEPHTHVALYDYVAHWRKAVVRLSFITFAGSPLGAKGLKVMTAVASALAVLSWVFSVD